MKFRDGDNSIRILSKPILGWLDWHDNKPVRTPYSEPKPAPIDPKRSVRHFWAFPVWDYTEKKVKILEITQAGIQEEIINLHSDEAWGDPTNYDLNVKKSGKDLETKYSVIARPPKPLDEEIRKEYIGMTIELEELFRNGDPFNPTGKPNAQNAEGVATANGEEIDVSNIDFGDAK